MTTTYTFELHLDTIFVHIYDYGEAAVFFKSADPTFNRPDGISMDDYHAGRGGRAADITSTDLGQIILVGLLERLHDDGTTPRHHNNPGVTP